MLRNKPRLTYKGLTIVLSNPSRFDKVSLLSGNAGQLMSDYCLRPELNTMQCDIRLADDMSPLLPGTKCVLLCGEYAMHKWLPETKENSIGEMRGSPFFTRGMVHIPTFFPQDAADFKNYEQQFNVLSKEYQPDANEYDTDDDEGDVKRHGRTARRNYSFWMRSDCRKAKKILALNGAMPPNKYPQPIYHIYPPSSVVIEVLENASGGWLWFDMETDYEQANMQCFSFSVDGINYYSIPTLDHNYKPAYSNCHKILQALVLCIARNRIVAHNGACFDFLVLAYKYRIAIFSAYDTLVAMHRCFSDVEKSLGHCVSMWTWEKFHKDEDSQGYLTREQMMARLRYCAKDVYTMYLVHREIEAYSATIPGLAHSIETAMASIRAYVTVAVQGIRYNTAKVKEIMTENDQLMEQYMRCCNLLIGESGMKEVRSCVKNGKTKAFPGSNKQCVHYFHELLQYPVVARSKKTGQPSLGKQAIFKLALRHDNPVLQFIIAYREMSKSYSTLKFIPWKDDHGHIYDPASEIPPPPPVTVEAQSSLHLPPSLSFSSIR